MTLASNAYENGVNHQDGENIVVTPTLFESNGDPLGKFYQKEMLRILDLLEYTVLHLEFSMFLFQIII
jgi:hypothetical protein